MLSLYILEHVGASPWAGSLKHVDSNKKRRQKEKDEGSYQDFKYDCRHFECNLVWSINTYWFSKTQLRPFMLIFQMMICMAMLHGWELFDTLLTIIWWQRLSRRHQYSKNIPKRIAPTHSKEDKVGSLRTTTFHSDLYTPPIINLYIAMQNYYTWYMIHYYRKGRTTQISVDPGSSSWPKWS